MVLRSTAVRHGGRIAQATLRRHVATAANPTPSPASDDANPAAFGPKITSASRKRRDLARDASLRLSIDSTHEHRTEPWGRPHNYDGRVLAPAEQMAEFRKIQRETRSLGSRLEKRYVPTDMIHNPPAAADITLEGLMAAQTHIGHNTSLWNPANSRYIYGVRQGVHMIALETTAAHLRRAARVVEEVTFRGGLVLFAGTRKGQMEITTKAAELAGACHLFTKWTPGAITNRDVILNGHDMNVVNHLDEPVEGYERYIQGKRPLVPDLVVCLNPLENYTLLYECGLATVPTIGVIDTDADPSWVTYTIPANDDSFRSVALIAGVLGRAGEAGQKRRKEAAKNGLAHWQMPQDMARYIGDQKTVLKRKRTEVMNRFQINTEDFTDEEKALLMSGKRAASDVKVSEEDMMALMGAAGSRKKAAPRPDRKLTEVEVGTLRPEYSNMEEVDVGGEEVEQTETGGKKE